jgi:hypothetical protein
MAKSGRREKRTKAGRKVLETRGEARDRRNIFNMKLPETNFTDRNSIS